MRTIRILDLFSGAGGCAVGYHRAFADAGYAVEITGVDIVSQPRYPYHFCQADAMTFALDGYDFIHASPPCQHYSILERNMKKKGNYPDLLAATRSRLQGRLYIIENVLGAPLINPVMLCGKSFGLKVQRHRLFESSVMLMSMPCNHQGITVGVYGTSTQQWFIDKHGRRSSVAEWKEAMGIDWMTGKELSQAIPPIYTWWLGMQIANVIAQQEDVA